MLVQLYQTIEDRSNYAYVEQKGPFLCSRPNAWLGTGFYFWDTFIDHAYWWGDCAYRKNNKHYIICHSKVEFSPGDLYDLCDSNTLDEFHKIVDALLHAYPHRTITVPFVIEHIKKHTSFTYKAIRVEDTSKTLENTIPFHVPYPTRYVVNMNLMPRRQICILDRTIIGVDNYKIIYKSSSTQDNTTTI